jgi:hypothetical protein
MPRASGEDEQRGRGEERRKGGIGGGERRGGNGWAFENDGAVMAMMTLTAAVVSWPSDLERKLKQQPKGDGRREEQRAEQSRAEAVQRWWGRGRLD